MYYHGAKWFSACGKGKNQGMHLGKVMVIFGTRPEAIKMAPVIKELKKVESIDTVVAVTAQHREMLDQVLNLFNIKPDYDLNIMKDRQNLFGITADVLHGLHNIMEQEARTWSWCTATPPLPLPAPWPLFIIKSRWDMWRPACGRAINILPIRKR
jgi:hypothetical protein